MFKIGYRTVKTAIGTVVSISIAQLFNLEYFISAGIITLLSIQVTKKKSLQVAVARFTACIVGILFSFLFFEGFGYHPVSIGLLLLFFIPTAVVLKVTDGIASSFVIILHFYAGERFTFSSVLNELLLIAIGIGVALVVNMYMPSAERQLKAYQKTIEDLFRKILQEIVHYLRTNHSDWDGRELMEAADILEKAKSLSLRNIENRLLRNEDYYYRYFEMREKQFDIIEHVLPIVTSITYTVEQRTMVADFIEDLSNVIGFGNNAPRFLHRLHEMKMKGQVMELPKTREEFEERAALLHFVKEMERYLIIKARFNDGR